KAIEAFKPHRYGKIINLSGGGATNALPGISAYAASKAAVVRFTETLALEMKEFGIEVNSVAPGALTTRLTDQLIAAGPERVMTGRQAIEADVDAVIVATTHDQLAGIAIGAIEAGRHVLVEKPAGRTLVEAQAIAAAADKHKRIVKTGFNHRFHPAFLKAREI